MITNNFTCESLFKDYFSFWIKLYKEGAVRPVTLEKYWNNQRQIARIIPELHSLLEDLDLGMEITWDWLILLIAKTGLRFSEALGLTPADFDFARQTISVSKTWDYKTNTGFQPTKNRSSVRKVQMDWQLGMQFQQLIRNLDDDKPIFVNGPVCNSTPNKCLERHCRKCGIPIISIHGLRHTHASLLMFAGVSIASVSRRLGHSSITTTQKVYMHIISELENQDNDLVMRYLASLS